MFVKPSEIVISPTNFAKQHYISELKELIENIVNKQSSQ